MKESFTEKIIRMTKCRKCGKETIRRTSELSGPLTGGLERNGISFNLVPFDEDINCTCNMTEEEINARR